MRISWSKFVFICTYLSLVSGGNILVLHFPPTGSFMNLLQSILMKLATYHKITLYTILYNDFSHPNISVIHVNVPAMKTYFSSENIYEHLCNFGPFHVCFGGLTSITEEYIDVVYKNENITNLLASNASYDTLIMSASLSEYALPFADFFKVPLIQIAPTVPFLQNNDATGNILFQTSTYNLLSYYQPIHLFNRLKIYMHNMKAHLAYSWYFWDRINKSCAKYFPPGTKSAQQINSNTSLLLTNINRALGYVKPEMPHVLNIGGIYCRPAKPLPPELEEFISGAEHGIIYVSFGWSIQSKLPEPTKQIMMNVFRKLPHRILWKQNENLGRILPNVWQSNWFAQQDILGHNKTKLFITQGGVLSAHESVYHQVPMLVLPISFDQPMNSFLVQQMGYGEFINICELTEEELFMKINKIIDAPKYKSKVVQLSRLLKEDLKLVDGRLINAVDYIIRNNGNPIIHNLPHGLSGFQKMDADIIVILVFLFEFICICIIYLLVSTARKYFYKHVYVKQHLD